MKRRITFIFTPERVVTFSDGIIAITLSLMVFNMEIPEFADNLTRSEIYSILLTELLPTLSIYFISFLSVGIFWISHHNFFYLLKKVDSHLLWLNLGLLFPITLIPMTTGFLAKTPLSPDATAGFAFNLFFCLTLFGCVIFHAYRKNLMKDNLEKKSVRRVLYLILIACILWIVAFVTSYIHIVIPYVIFLIISILFFIPQEINYLDKEEENI